MTPPAKSSKVHIRVNGEMLYVPDDQVTTLVVCERTGAIPHECGNYQCENGCRDVELTFVRAEVVDV